MGLHEGGAGAAAIAAARRLRSREQCSVVVSRAAQAAAAKRLTPTHLPACFLPLQHSLHRHACTPLAACSPQHSLPLTQRPLLPRHPSSHTHTQVDATQDAELAQKFGVQGYPTLKWFVDGEVAMDYSGARDA